MKRIPFWTALIALLLAIALLSPALADNTTSKRGDVITMGQLLSLPLVVAGAVLIVYAQRKARPQCDYLEK